MVVSLPAVAQQAGLNGSVSDPTGAVVPGASLTLTDKGTGATRTTTTGPNGTYIFTQIDPGQYRLEISMPGFKTLVHDPIFLQVGFTSTLDAKLEIGAVTEQVVVEEGVVAFNATDASLGIPFTGIQVLQLPSANLDPAGLLSLQPGVTFFPSAPDVVGGYSGSSDLDGRGGTVQGARSDQTNITLDGVDVNDPTNGFAFSSVLRSTQASLAEFRTTTSNNNADSGRSSAAQVQLVTKSGSNTLHGSAYYANRNERFSANDFFNNAATPRVEKGKFRRHIYGASLGGPIVKDRLFIFGNFERLEHAEEATVLRTIPSESFKDGVLLYQCEDPALCPGGSVSGVSGTHSVPAGFHGLTSLQLAAIDPLGIGPNPNVLSYLAGFPVSNDTGNFDGFNLVGFRFNAPVENDFKTYIARLDLNLDRAGNHTFFARGTLQDDSVVRTLATFPGQDPAQIGLNNSRGLALGYVAVLSPTIINSTRYGYTRIGEKNAGVLNSEFSDLRFINDLSGFDRANVSSNARQLPLHHVRNDTSITKGKSTFSFGIDFLRNNTFTNVNSFNEFITNPSWMPNVGRNVTPGTFDCGQSDPTATAGCNAVPAVAGSFQGSFRDTVINMLGITSQVNGNFNFLTDGSVLASGDPVLRRFAVNEFEGYFQHQWRMTPSLTLTYGARYYVATPPWETNGQQVAPVPNLGQWFESRRTLMLSGIPTNQAASLSFDLAGPANNGPNYYQWDWNNWSPRVAVAWAPKGLGAFSGNGKLVIRGGWSLVYDRLGNGLVTSFDAAGSFGMSTGLTSTFGGCDEGFGAAPLGSCPRFTGQFDTSAATAQLLPAAPPGGFPAVPPGALPGGGLAPGAFAIATALDGSITTPYANVFSLTISREFRGGIVVEAGYVGRRGRNLLISRDLAMPADVCEPTSGSCYFSSSQNLAALFEAGVDINSVAPDPFWETFFPSWGPGGINGGAVVCGVAPGSDFVTAYSATQVAYDWVNCLEGDTTVVPFCVDISCGGGGFPGFALGGPNDPDIPQIDTDGDGIPDTGDGLPDARYFFFDDQFATLNAWSSIARSEYHAFQLSVRKAMSHGVQFGFNYTLSHSLDHSSDPERTGVTAGGNGFGGFSGSTINAWELDLEYSSSDFDLRHQVNSNYIIDLPFGHGRALGSGMPGWANQIVGGWQVSGIARYNSGQVVNIFNGRVWATNWNLSGNAVCAPAGASTLGVQTAPCISTQNVKNGTGDVGPNLFADPAQALTSFRHALPGERGGRNILRGDDYFNLDFAVSKSFPLPMEGHSFNFRWEIFNLTNSVYFDAGALSVNILRPGTFGNYTGTLGSSRFMQVSLRYQF